jgi:hypothetical protein
VRDVAGRVVVHQCCAWCERLVEREHRGQDFVLDRDPVHRRAGGFGVHRRDRRNLVADVAHLIEGEGIEIRAERAPLALRGVGAGRDRLDAGQGRRGAGVDGEDAGVRVGASQHRCVQHAREVQIGDVLRRAGDFGNGVRARYVLADDKQTGGCRYPGITGDHGFLAFARAIASR